MSGGAWVALITTGCFFTLSCFANGAHPAPKARTFAEKQFVAARKAVEELPQAAEVRIWKAASRMERVVAQANGHGAPDKVAFTGSLKRAKCGEDFVCLLAWAKEQRP